MRSKLGALIAWLGGIVGVAIIIYALLGERFLPGIFNRGGEEVAYGKATEAALEAIAEDKENTASSATGEAAESAASSAVASVGEADPAKTGEAVENEADDAVADVAAAPVKNDEEGAEVASAGAGDADVDQSSADDTQITVGNADADTASTEAPITEEVTAEAVAEDVDAAVEATAEVEPETPTGNDDTQVAGTSDGADTVDQTGQAPDAPQLEVATVAEPSIVGGTSASDGPAVSLAAPEIAGTSPVVLKSVPSSDDQKPALDPDDPSVPKFDLVRIEADGSAVIAGRAAPNSDVEILSNGEAIAVARASSKGEFVALVDTKVSKAAQSLALVASAPDGGKVTSQANVIVLARSAVESDNPDEEISLAPAIVQAAPEELRVIQPVVGLADLDRVSLDTISYDEAGQVILAGRGRPGNVARVYADASVLKDATISTGGTWSATINDLNEGRYVIRVDELDQNGDVLSRVESPFQRIFPSAEQLALLTDASSVIVQPGNNLWRIAERRYGEGFRYTTIFEANKEQIRDPDLIYPGQVFELPSSPDQ